MPLNLGEHGRVRFEIRELPRKRFRLTLEVVVDERVAKQLDRRDFENEPDCWAALSTLAADKQAEFALKAAEVRRL